MAATGGWPDGLTRYNLVLDEAEQSELLAFAEEALRRGRQGELAGKSYVPLPDEWVARGQGRETVHFGVLVKCNKVLNARVEPIPPPLVAVAQRLVERGILGADCAPDAVCLNAYEASSWLPAHVDSAAFDRPFCTLSLLSHHAAIFGEGLASDDPVSAQSSAAAAAARVDMPPGSVLRVDGESAGPSCKHGLPPHPSRRISFTFRKLSAETRTRHEAIRLEAAGAQERRRERRVAAKAARGGGAAAEHQLTRLSPRHLRHIPLRVGNIVKLEMDNGSSDTHTAWVVQHQCPVCAGAAVPAPEQSPCRARGPVVRGVCGCAWGWGWARWLHVCAP